jgi:Putative oxalocrotonate tautomerase enzyme
MPLWHIYCPENAYSAEDKCALATRITDLYADAGLPRFCIKTDRESFGRSPVFFGHTSCPICHADHAWFAGGSLGRRAEAQRHSAGS